MRRQRPDSNPRRPAPPGFGPAGFEPVSERQRLARMRWQLPAAIVGALAAAIVLIGFLGRPGPPAPSPVPSAAVVRPALATPSGLEPTSATRATMTTPAVVLPRLPERLACHGVVESLCAGIVRAALMGLPSGLPAVAAASVWGSLYCDSTPDCPPDLLRRSVPLGSAVISFVDGGPYAWMNVVGSNSSDNDGADDLRAWVVRWQVLPAMPG